MSDEFTARNFLFTTGNVFPIALRKQHFIYLEQLFFPPSLPSQSVHSVYVYLFIIWVCVRVSACVCVCDTSHSRVGWLVLVIGLHGVALSFVGYMRVCGGTGDPLLFTL